MTQTEVAWRGEDDPGRVDRAVISIGDTGMTAEATSVTSSYATAWALDATDSWRTHALEITAHGEGWARSLTLTRADDGQWAADARMHGETDLPPAGLADPDSVAGALDCDIGLCPVTNTMPIRRLGLLTRTVPETPLVMAWIEVPSLRVLRSDQVYSSSAPGRVRFRSDDFHAELTVDPDGIVIDYPGLASRLDRRAYAHPMSAEVSTYLSTIEGADLAALERVYSIARELVPEAEEGMSYAMPALLYRGKGLIATLRTKKSLAIYPYSGSIVAANHDALTDFETTTGSIHYSAEHQLPDAVLRRIIQARRAEIDANAR